MQQRDPTYIDDILQAARRIGSYVEGIDEDVFARDEMRQDAVIRQLEIIGEASRNLSAEFREQHPGVEWRKIIGMRNLLAHAYRSVGVSYVWEAAVRHVVELETYLKGLAASADDGDQ